MAKKPKKGERPFVLVEDDSDEELACPIPDEDGWVRLKRKREPTLSPEKRTRKDGRKK